MKFNTKKAEIALFFGLIIAILTGAANAQASSVSEKLIRLHVIANSDSTADQTLKLKVRDEIVPLVKEITQNCTDIYSAKQNISDNLAALQSCAENVVAENGADYSVKISFENCFFPTKEYDGFALPAGEYFALRVIIGEGAGKNWWCVLFPPLCLPAAEENVAETAAAAGLSRGEIAFITEDGSEYKIKFKTAEICANAYHLISDLFN